MLSPRAEPGDLEPGPSLRRRPEPGVGRTGNWTLAPLPLAAGPSVAGPGELRDRERKGAGCQAQGPEGEAPKVLLPAFSALTTLRSAPGDGDPTSRTKPRGNGGGMPYVGGGAQPGRDPGRPGVMAGLRPEVRPIAERDPKTKRLVKGVVGTLWRTDWHPILGFWVGGLAHWGPALRPRVRGKMGTDTAPIPG